MFCTAGMNETADVFCNLIDALKEKGEEIPHALVVNNLIALYNLRKPEAKNVALSILHTDGELNID